MACEKYSELMMQYMDGVLTADGKANLDEHMNICEGCQEDFAAYNEILQGINDAVEIVEAPADFASSVMAKVSELNLYAPKQVKARSSERLIDGIIFAAWLVFAVTIFAGAALAIFGEQIVEWANTQGFYALSEILYSMSNFVATVTTAIAGLFSNMGESAGGTTIFYSMAFLVLFIGLVLLQIYIAPKKKTLAIREDNIE